jgi:predicted O-linked N-acetylglucosamine transferase (SPINDLY family)
LGLIEAASGNLDEADRLLTLSDRIAPGNPDWSFNLGKLAALKGEQARARDLFSRVVSKDKRNLEALVALGGVLLELGQPLVARKHLQTAYRMDKKRPDIVVTLGLAEMANGNPSEAEKLCREGVESAPDWADAHNNLAYVLRMQGKDTEAEAECNQALVLQPEHLQALVNLGTIFQNRSDMEKARDFFQRALRVNPSNVDARFGLADIAITEGFLDDGRFILTALIGENPRNWRARWLDLVGLPQVYENEEHVEAERQRFSEMLDHLAADMESCLSEDLSSILGAVSYLSNFFLHYTGGDVRDIQSRYGRLLTRIAATAYPKRSNGSFSVRKGGKITVGFASSFFYRHSVMKSHGCWVTGLPRDRFDVTFFHLGEVVDETTKLIARDANYVDCSKLSQPQLIERIYSEKLDVLIWLDIGMDAKVQVPAALRLAPIQATGFGHPVTSGLPSIDAYLTGDVMEPVGGEAHYTEKLVRLPNLSVAYRMPDLSDAPLPDEITRLKGEGKIIYLCGQSLFKLLPAQDELVIEVAGKVPNSVFAFIAHGAEHVTKEFQERLGRRFSAKGLAPEGRIIMLPRMNESQFQAVTRAADVVLDSIGWSGFNSTLEAIAVGTPVMTMPGETMRADHTAGILRMAGLGEFIAPNIEGYITLAVRLGMDGVFRKSVSDAILECRSRVFDDHSPILHLAQWIEREVCG